VSPDVKAKVALKRRKEKTVRKRRVRRGQKDE
jgi:hypothetical protein